MIHKNQAANRKSAITAKAAHLEPSGKKKEALTSSAIPAQTRDAEHGSLQCVRGIVGSALDIGVGHRDHLERRRETSLIPATRLGTHRLELPGRHPTSRARSASLCPLPAVINLPRPRTPDARALVISTGATPVASAQRSCSIATPVRPANAASATAKLVTSDRPPKYRRT